MLHISFDSISDFFENITDPAESNVTQLSSDL
jgi:hypothetical protein